jgi:hypothetical protein
MGPNLALVAPQDEHGGGQRMEPEHGTLIRTHGRQLPVRLVARGDESGRDPAYFELHDLPEPLEEDEVVAIRRRGGQCFRCQVLDSSNICAVIVPLFTDRQFS